MSEYTPSQLRAITARGRDMLISAGAGSGKTMVLTQRVIGLVCEKKANIDEILVVTFTRDAASRMKAKIRSALTDEMNAEGADRAYLLKQLKNMDSAHISTIDAFCYDIVREFHYVLDIDPASRLLNNEERDSLTKKALTELFEKAYEEENEAFALLEDAYSSGSRSDGLKNIILNAAEFTCLVPDGVAFLYEKANALSRELGLGSGLNGLSVNKYLSGYAAARLKRGGTLIKEAVSLLAACDAQHAKLADLRELERSYESLTAALNKGLDFFTDELNETQISSARFVLGKNIPDKTEISEKRKKAKEILTALKDFFGFSADTCLKQLTETLKHIYALCDAVREYTNLYSELKRRKKALDFNDLERLCLKMILNPEYADKIKSRFKYVFIDEYQDVNEIQEAIFSSLAPENAFFAVGDIKQSIYAFRGAKSRLFGLRVEAYKNNLSGELVRLSDNFRTDECIIEYINALFSVIMTDKTAGISYFPDETLRAANNALPSGFVPTLILTDKSIPSEDEDNSPLTSDMKEGETLAALIEKLLTEQIYDEELKALRFIVPGDIAVLNRNMKLRLPAYSQALTKAGISFKSVSTGGFFESIETVLALNLLRLTDNAQNDIALTGVMRSFLYNFTEDELVQMRLINPKAFYFHECAVLYRTNGTDKDLKQKLERLYSDLALFKKIARNESLEKLLSVMYEATGLYTAAGVLNEAEERLNNLDYLKSLAANFEAGTQVSLSDFIELLEQAKKSGGINPPASQKETGECVSLMTIHASKGLEFNVVILTGCGSSLSRGGYSPPVIVNRELGLCLKYFSQREAYRCDTLLYKAAETAEDEQELNEELRLLYVAATRAKKRLYFSAAVNLSTFKQLPENPDSTDITEKPSYAKWLTAAGESAIKIITADELISETEIKGKELLFSQKPFSPVKGCAEAALSEPANETTLAKISHELSYTYPYLTDTVLPSKLSVSEIKQGGIDAGAVSFSINDSPLFTADSAENIILTPTMRGTLTHRFLEKFNIPAIDLNRLAESIEEEITRLTGAFVFDETEAKGIDREALYSFFPSNTGRLLLTAQSVTRELKFIMNVPANELSDAWKNTDEPIIVQGIVDCVLLNNGKTIILDYKTDRTKTAAELNERIEHYAVQINFYRRAVEKSMKISVDEAYICLLNMGIEKKV